MITISRSFQFDSAHRVLNHQGKCRYLHGHRYEAKITVSSPKLDNMGMVIDFGVVKEKIGIWIKDNLDHNIILHPDDPLLQFTPKYLEDMIKFWGSSLRSNVLIKDPFGGRDPFVMPFGLDNPTAENIAQLLAQKAQILLPNFSIYKVEVHETPNCKATFYPPNEEEVGG